LGTGLESELENLVNRLKPVTYVYKFKDEKPYRVDKFLDVGVWFEVDGQCKFITFWFRWDHDWEGDGVENWEPVTYVLKKEEVIDIQTRPHWNLVSWLTDEPILENEERAIVYFSKNGHAPYLSVPSTTEVGWLKSAMIKMELGRKIGMAILDFLEVMDERSLYVKISGYKVKKDYGPTSTSKALTGIEILGKKLLDRWYKKPEAC
jgi:hypothetical protein